MDTSVELTDPSKKTDKPQKPKQLEKLKKLTNFQSVKIQMDICLLQNYKA